jgi:hypothetical protein
MFFDHGVKVLAHAATAVTVPFLASIHVGRNAAGGTARNVMDTAL